MIDEILAALDRQDYQRAGKLLKQLQQTDPHHPWLPLYIGRWQEGKGKLEAANSLYRRVLQATQNPKIAMQARLGLQRLETKAQPPKLILGDREPGFLILEAVKAEQKQALAQQLAQIASIDAYSARMLLPSRGWRLHRTAAIAELQHYGQQLQAAQIPSFWVPQAQVEKLRVFRVQFLQTLSPQPAVVCKNEADQSGTLSFAWREVRDRVEGMLPVFEDVVDVGAYNKLTRKRQTQDYAQVTDLHLPQRGCILRFADWSYQFQHSAVFNASQDGALPNPQATTRLKWNQLITFLDRQLASVPVWSEFAPFAETALEPLALTKAFPSHIDLLRKLPSQWDRAFQLYSALVFLRQSELDQQRSPER